jgi:AraC-like DNA-binding protein
LAKGAPGDQQLDRLLQESLRFEPLCGNVSSLRKPHSTGWRTLPGLMCSQVHRGRDVMYLASGGALRVATGELMVLPAGILHRVDLATPTAVTRWAHVNYFVLHNLDLFSLLEVPPVLPRRLGTKVGDTIEEWVGAEAGGGGAVLRNARRNAFGYRLLALLSGACRLRPDAERSLSDITAIRPVVEHMNRHLEGPLDRDELAGVAGMSRAQFHRVFLQATGSSPVRFLRSIRMRLAQQLLISSGAPVKTVAQRCGYEDVFVFSKTFKRDCGLSPSVYRLRTGELRADRPESDGRERS